MLLLEAFYKQQSPTVLHEELYSVSCNEHIIMEKRGGDAFCKGVGLHLGTFKDESRLSFMYDFE